VYNLYTGYYANTTVWWRRRDTHACGELEKYPSETTALADKKRMGGGNREYD